ncbi:MAG TPA: FHA domain-containing protein [Firmicutes bacterium]|jgi:hypothetical protein|nr:FHA domain-containing protein [Bacillota bacterium]HOQ23650.1 FHA domain-containing protein [Bacillota bacterium]HPT67066.1 FHA domain-containing protein [Bacillota bacterium]
MGVWRLVRKVMGLKWPGQSSDKGKQREDELLEETRIYKKANATANGKRRYRLVVLTGRDMGREYLLMPTVMKIGRKDDCFVLLTDTKASREHALLRYRAREDGYVLEDLGSTNGTYLNDRRIRQEYLRSGDIIRVGETTMQFLLLEATEASKH